MLSQFELTIRPDTQASHTEQLRAYRAIQLLAVLFAFHLIFNGGLAYAQDLSEINDDPEALAAFVATARIPIYALGEENNWQGSGSLVADENGNIFLCSISHVIKPVDFPETSQHYIAWSFPPVPVEFGPQYSRLKMMNGSFQVNTPTNVERALDFPMCAVVDGSFLRIIQENGVDSSELPLLKDIALDEGQRVFLVGDDLKVYEYTIDKYSGWQMVMSAVDEAGMNALHPGVSGSAVYVEQNGQMIAIGTFQSFKIDTNTGYTRFIISLFSTTFEYDGRAFFAREEKKLPR